MGYLSEVANYLLYTPFDDKAIVPGEVSTRLTPEAFCERCYSAPLFKQDIEELYKKGEKDSNDNDQYADLKELEDDIYWQKRASDNFHLWLNDHNNIKVYTINGNAGTGKSTYINYLKHKEKDKRWLILDIARVGRYIKWFGDITTTVKEFSFAYKKVYASILDAIKNYIFKGIIGSGRKSIEIIYKNLKLLDDNYVVLFADSYPSGYSFFNDLHKIVNNKNNTAQIVVKSAKYFHDYFSKVENLDSPDSLYEALNILIIVMRCMSKKENKNQYIIVFDNFERFIAKDEIYNNEVDEIRKILVSYNRQINEEDNCHSGMLKTIMVIRNSTARMCGVRLQSADELPSNLDLSKWFDTNDIINQKIKWYNENNILIPDIKLIEQIAGDIRICKDKTVTGLKLLIDPLFNNNKRLIIDFIGQIVETPSNSYMIEKYIQMWNREKGLSIFAARSIIRGLILKRLEEVDNLFKNLKTYSDNANMPGVGETRKILTILLNHLNKNSESEMAISDVLQELLGTNNIKELWKENDKEYLRQTISEILFFMNSYNRRDNDWLHFVDLQINNVQKSITIDNPAELEDILTKDMNKFTISIMPAGIAYLKYIVASFEFFSFRYSAKYEPLFVNIPEVEEIERCENVKELKCYKIIFDVEKYAYRCIEWLKSEDILKLYLSSSDTGTTHIDRIIIQHKSYLDQFIDYIRVEYLETYIEQNIKDKYQELIDEIIEIRDTYGNRGKHS